MKKLYYVLVALAFTSYLIGCHKKDSTAPPATMVKPDIIVKKILLNNNKNFDPGTKTSSCMSSATVTGTGNTSVTKRVINGSLKNI